MKGFKKGLALFLAMLMILAVSPIAAFAEGEEPTTTEETTTETPETPEAAWYTSFGMKKGEGTLAEAAANVTAGGSIAILKDLTITETIAFTKNTTVEGNGFTLIRSDDFTGVMMTIDNAAKITFSNITIDGDSDNIPYATENIVTVANGTLFLNSGAKLIKNFASGATGGAVVVGSYDSAAATESALVINEGAEISDCTAAYGGAAIALYGATIKLAGGTIRDCYALSDGGAFDMARKGAKFIMQSGEITGCRAGIKNEGSWGSAISVESGTSAMITGGKITNNLNMGSNLGAVYVEQGASVTVGDSVYIAGNTAKGDKASNIYLEKNTVLKVDPAFAEGAEISVTIEDMDPNNISPDFINYDGDMTGFVYCDTNGDTFYVSGGIVTLIEVIKVTFDPGNGTCEVASRIYPVDVEFGYLPTPDEREGFEFLGWYTANDVLITEDSAVTFHEDITLYAKWENLNKLDDNPFAVIGRFFERIAELMREAFRFLANLFTGTGDKDLGNL